MNVLEAADFLKYTEEAVRRLTRQGRIKALKNLVSGAEAVCIVAASINWHTLKEIQDQAEGVIAKMTCKSARWVDQWLFRDSIQMPVVR